MGHGRPAAVALVLGVGLLPAAALADNATASASARITLHVAPRVHLRKVAGGDREQLCLGHIPARSYVLVASDSSGSGKRLPGRAGSYCLPLSFTEEAGEVMIVAQ